ncbi:MAG: DNA polymerase III subunit beta [Oscillospiraceae bacterium]|nr:DNA polymerase III subunit beta [Oscillospiraceae bacterium]
MKFTCERALLAEAVSTTNWAVSSKSSIQALEGLLLEAGEGLTVTGYNLETGIQTTINANIIEPGNIVINAKLLSDIIRLCPDEEVTVTVTETQTVLITCCDAKYEIIGFSAEEYPNLPEIETEQTLSLPQNVLKSMINQTIFAISTNDNKPIHTGSLFEVENGRLNVVSVDGFRLAIRTEALESIKTDIPFSFVVPGHTLREVEKLMDDVEDLVEIMLGRKHITFSIGTTTIIARILEGEFLNYKNAIPKTNTISTSVVTKELITSLERVSILINERIKNPVRCIFSDNFIQLLCTTPLGKSQDHCRLLEPSEKLEIGFNNRYLIDALKACPDAEVKLELNTHLSPIVMKPKEGDSYLYLILPVRLKADNE